MLLVAGVALSLLAGNLHAQDRRPVPEVMANPQYPYEMSRAGIGGRVKVEFVIGPGGGVIEAKILQATHREFEKPALAAVMKWKFKPGMKGGKPVNVRASQVLEFNLDAPPVYPFELLTEKIEGTATIQFAIDTNGRATGVTVFEASRPEFGKAAQAAVMASTYAPAFADQPEGDTARRANYRFLLNGKGEAPINDAARRLLAKFKPSFEVTKFSQLDRPPARKVYPEPKLAPDTAKALGAGSAVVEVFIDADGKVLLPRIISATHEEFGYVAAQAVVDWKYESPEKGGKRTLAQGKLQINFEAKNGATEEHDLGKK